ncbi:RNA polymerase sigma factor [Actinomadura litoris]|uniref:RNA polymerase sigma factor n=1 Tax=Actinomadura litoris TaxID=2678616 RepID=UPI001FA6E2DC|nr:RNA polymerase sigma factor [Actinomadura litoris]
MESSLRARLRAGDQDAFAEIFDEHAAVVYRHAVRTVGDRAAAEDVVSLTYLEAWRQRERIRPDGESLRPWLLGIASNVLRNTARAARRHRAALARLPRGDTVPDFADDLVGRMADAEQLAAARAALDRLRPKEREVFTLVVWSGLDYAEAAEALGVPVGTVRSRLSRARARLRELADAVLGEAETEPGALGGQLDGDRAEAVRSTQEKPR